MLKLISVVILGSIICINSIVNCHFTTRYNFDAVLYEEYSVESRSVQFSRTNREEWWNISSVMEANQLQEKSLLCTRGIGHWFAFPAVDLKPDGLRYWLIKGDTCVPAKMIESLTPIGTIREKLDNAMLLFDSLDFGGLQTIVNKENPSGAMDAQSLLIFGTNTEYLIEGAEGKVCVKSPIVQKLCLMRNLETSLGLTGSKMVTYDAKCAENDDSKLVYVQNCFAKSFEEIPVHHDVAPKNLNELCKGDLDQPSKNQITTIMEIIEGRVSRKLVNKEYIHVPPAANYKVETIWEIFSIFKKLCTVNRQYLNIVRAVFLQHLKRLWETNPESVGVEDEKWKDLHDFVLLCKRAAANQGASPISTDCSAEMDLGGEADNQKETNDLNEMMEDEGYDSIIDHMWIILKTVTPVCNQLNDFDDNKWTAMLSLLRSYYTIPLAKQWQSPGVWQRSYPTMFLGFNIMEEKKKLKMCSTSLWDITDSFDSLGRETWFSETDFDIDDPAQKQRFHRKRPPTPQT